MLKIYPYIILFLSAVLASCSPEKPPQLQSCGSLPNIYPDYIGVTIPAEIAPMNFNILPADSVDCAYVDVIGSISGEMHTAGSWAEFNQKEWRKLTEANRGGSLSFQVTVKAKNGEWKKYDPFEMRVSRHPLADYGVTYRKIAPGFETFSKIGIYQRQLSTFDESPIIEETAVNGQCLNCHYANRANPQQFTVHIRGKNGGTLVSKDGSLSWLNTKAPGTVGNCTYGFWHPGGRYCAFSLNRIYQNFYVGKDKIIEPWDAYSDIVVLDTETNEIITVPELCTEDFQTTPAFSADGSTLYFCTAPFAEMPANYDKLKYSLCSVAFDAANAELSQKIDTIINAVQLDKSICLPRPSYDGKYLMYCIVDYGTTPINRMESDLWLMNLADGSTRCLNEINSDETDAYHNWSADSQWFVFGSKRQDRLTSLLYFACIDDDGNATKPFLLPQKNPLKFYTENMHSFNAPDFTSSKVQLDATEARCLVMSGSPTPVTLK